MPGHLDDSAGERRPAVIVVHDFFGLAESTKAVTARLAAQGYLVFAPDLYRGQVATTRAEAIALAQSLAWNRVAIELGLATNALRERNENAPVAVLGFAMGGAAALVAAAAVAKLAAAVTFYGIPQDVTIENPNIKIQGHFATRDPKCTPPRIEALDRALHEHLVSHELHHYEADNGFFDPTRPETYSESAATLAWNRALGFLSSTLR